jgi:1-acyl-sn-glycerol-3-phosphate acyltransferase
MSASPSSSAELLSSSHPAPTIHPRLDRRRRDRCTFTPALWPRVFYRLNWLHGKWIWNASISAKIVRPELVDREDAFILATTHLSHLEPFLASIVLRRKIDWMTRIEFFKYRVFAILLKWNDAFAVNRQGVPVSAIRSAIARLRQGRVVGICPEGGVAIGDRSACRGGALKRGAALLAQRTGAPIIPCVLLGTHKLNAVGPWVPFRRGRLWIAFGEPIYADPSATDRKSERERVTEILREKFQVLYRELLGRYQISDSDVP